MHKIKIAIVAITVQAPLWVPVIAEARSSWGK